MKLRHCLFLPVLLLGMAGAVQAAPASRALIYIDSQEYRHEVKLWHFYYSYWFSQGEALQPLALETLAPLFAGIGMCEEHMAADVVIWLRPRMFYNPHMTTFHGSILAQVYSGSGKPLATYRAGARHIGHLDIVPAAQVAATYRAALDELLRQMRSDTAMQAVLAAPSSAGETPMPCGMVTILPAARP